MHCDDELPSLAVVIPCWNAEKWVARAIKSVLGQQYPNIELIVIDDGSTDGSLDIIRSFGDKIRWETGPNNGPCAARNRGLAIATAKYIHFLDADDCVLHGFYHSIGKRLAEDNEEIIVAPLLIDDGVRLQIYDEFYSVNGALEWLIRVLETGMPQTGQVIWLSSFLSNIGGWNESVLKNQDWELNIRGTLHASKIAYHRMAVAYYNQHPDGARVSRNRQKSAVESSVRFLKELECRVLEAGGAKAATALATQYYSSAMWAFGAGYSDLGRAALRYARHLGLKGHPGGLRHQVFATIFGLELKQKISELRRRRLMIKRRV
jgi:glycosyltransferase involved in cell wall biosynthesis